MGLGVGAATLLAVGGSFWALPHIEHELDEAALEVPSYVDADGFVVEWNGRDGFLTVPAGTPRTQAERVAADLANLDGTRDVEILFADADETAVDETDADESDEDEDVDETDEGETAAPALASFTIDWDATSVEQMGTAPVDLAGPIEQLGVDSPLVGEDLTVDAGVATDLEVLAPLIQETLVEGRAEVVDGELSVTGVAASQTDLDVALSALEGIDADVSVDPDLSADAQPSIDSESTAEPGSEDDAANEADVATIQERLDAVLAGGVEFQTNTNLPTSPTEGVIDAVAEILAEYPELAVEIVGHTDSRGDEAANQALSESRSQAVLDGLVQRGIESQRLAATGRGSSEPVASNDTIDGQQRNRRVEITIKESN